MTSAKKIITSCAIGVLFAITVGIIPASPGGGEALDPRKLYGDAQSLAERGKYRRAAKTYGRIVADFPSSPIAAESMFREAECLELVRDYYRAFKVYQDLLENFPSFPNTSEVIDRQLRIGAALMNKRGLFSRGLFGRNLSRAREIFRRVVQNAPFGDSAPLAQFNLAMTYEMRKSYSEAIMEYGKVISSYPGSDAIDDADYHIALCHYKKANRSPHDQPAASKAVSTLKGFLKRYPDSPKAQDAKVKLEEIAGRKAKALYDIARFYEKTGSPKSAIYYYQEVIEGNPELEIAKRAQLKIRRDYELAEVYKRIEELSDELDAIKDEMAYSKKQIKRLRQPEVRWHVWEQLIGPKGAKGERIVQERERLSSLKKEAREKKKDIRKVLEERRNVYRTTSAQLRLDEVRRKHHIAQMNLEAARDDRPALSTEEDYGAALKAYEKNLDKKSWKLERRARAVSRAEKRLEAVKESVEGKKAGKVARLAKRSRLRKKKLRQEQFRKKLAELAADLSSEQKSARTLYGEKRKQASLLKRCRRKGAPDEIGEAEVNLSLITSRYEESQERVSEIKREIARRRRIREIERRYKAVLRKERRTEADLHRIEAVTYEKKKPPFSFFKVKGDPVSRAVERLGRLRRERRLLENELSVLTAGGDFVTEKEKKKLERRAELERRRKEKAEAKQRRKKEEELARGGKAADSRMKLEREYSRLLEQEEEAGARIEELMVKEADGRKRGWLFFRPDPVRKAERRLEKLRRRRDSLERKLGWIGEGGPSVDK